ncbi:MAG TPA: glycosyltransferase family 4 protein [Alphaproteobacteria bacterium]|nr:glycosyltransferase family 4 protein [Alphaproteobacteria bacterium]
MRLILVISSLQAGGAERYLSRLANYWVEKGHEITLVTFEKKGTKPFYHLDKKVNLVQLDLFAKGSSKIGGTFEILKRLTILRRFFKKNKPDRIISFVDITNITVLFATLFLKTPVIVSERTTPQCYPIGELYDCLRKILYPKAGVVVVQTKTAASYFSLKNIKIIANSVAKPMHQKRGWAEITKVCSAGRLIPSKAFDILLKAFAGVLQKYPHLTLSFYGKGPEEQTLKALTKSLKIEQNVAFKGAVSDITKHLIEADLFIFPSNFEGFPNALCEAMSVGLPVIASNCSGNIDVVQDKKDGLLFPVGDIATLEKAIITLIENTSLREQLAQNAMNISTRFSEQEIFEKWDELLYS